MFAQPIPGPCARVCFHPPNSRLALTSRVRPPMVGRCCALLTAARRFLSLPFTLRPGLMLRTRGLLFRSHFAFSPSPTPTPPSQLANQRLYCANFDNARPRNAGFPNCTDGVPLLMVHDIGTILGNGPLFWEGGGERGGGRLLWHIIGLNYPPLPPTQSYDATRPPQEAPRGSHWAEAASSSVLLQLQRALCVLLYLRDRILDLTRLTNDNGFPTQELIFAPLMPPRHIPLCHPGWDPLHGDILENALDLRKSVSFGPIHRRPAPRYFVQFHSIARL